MFNVEPLVHHLSSIPNSKAMENTAILKVLVPKFVQSPEQIFWHVGSGYPLMAEYNFMDAVFPRK